MTETTDELLLVERVGRLLHAADDVHLLIPLEQALFGHVDVEAGGVRSVPAEGVLVELDGERRVLGRLAFWHGRVCGREDGTRQARLWAALSDGLPAGRRRRRRGLTKRERARRVESMACGGKKGKMGGPSKG